MNAQMRAAEELTPCSQKISAGPPAANEKTKRPRTRRGQSRFETIGTHRAANEAIHTDRGCPSGRSHPSLTSALNFEIFHRGLSSIRDFFVLDDLTLIQSGKAGLLDGRDVNENVSPAALGWMNPYPFLD
jgi:hypothetical protein